MRFRTLFIALCWLPSAVPAVPLEQALDTAAAAQHDATLTQQRIERLDDQTREMLERWREAERRRAELAAYRDQLRTQTEAQSRQLEDMRRSVGEITTLERQIVPLMLEMAATLRNFVALDLPFQLAERQARLDRLDAALSRPDLDTGEKFRRLMEAWNIESEYGRTLEAWAGEVESAGGRRQVEFLRLGRLSLLYQTLDGDAGGIWDRGTGSWQPVERARLPELRKAIQVAREERAPGLLLLPVTAPEASP